MKQNTTIKRKLFAWEIQEARRVFGNGLNYDRVWVHECSRWPGRLDRIAHFLRRESTPSEPTAITVGNHCFFPELLAQSPIGVDSPEHYKIAWLIHELTHVWQYQHIGWRYLTRALRLQLREGIRAYYFGGGTELAQALVAGKGLHDFNIEQQGEISRSYYNRLTRGQDISVWQPFIDEIKNA